MICGLSFLDILESEENWEVDGGFTSTGALIPAYPPKPLLLLAWRFEVKVFTFRWFLAYMVLGRLPFSPAANPY